MRSEVWYEVRYCNLGVVIALVYVYMCMRDMGRCVGVFSLTELGAKIRSMKISSGTSGDILAKICTSENFLLYGMR